MRFRSLVLLTTLALSFGIGRAADVAEEIQKKVAVMTEAFFKGDFEKQIDLMPPKILELVGGREKMLAVLKRETAAMEANQMKVQSYEVGAPVQIVESDGTTFALMPSTLTLKTPTVKATKKSHVLGIGDGKGGWSFLRTEQGEEKVRLIVPNLPATMKIPAPQKPTIEKLP